MTLGDDVPVLPAATVAVVPKEAVPTITSKGRTIGGMVQISSNLEAVTSPSGTALRSFLCREADVLALIETGASAGAGGPGEGGRRRAR